ncbi:MAG: DUF4197 domain-containing protein [Mangrovibacterium sp.]
MKPKIILLGLILLMFNGCAEMQQIILNEQGPVTQTEIIAGLKQALSVGVDKSVAQLTAADGYLSDQALKILLPPEAEVITKNLSKLPGGKQMVDQVITSINHAASDAAKEAAPIILSSIKSMTIQDAAGILKGGDYAATNYLKKTSYNALVNLYSPKIQKSLQEKFVGNLTAQQSWDELTGKWNQIATSPIGQLANLQAVNTDLSSYLTQRALDGLFLKIGEAEKNIREDPAARVTLLLKRVFAQQ